MKKSLYFGIVTLAVAMSVVFTACKDDEEKVDEEILTDVRGISLATDTESMLVNKTLKIDSAKQSNKDGTIYIKLSGGTGKTIPAGAVYNDMFGVDSDGNPTDAATLASILVTANANQGYSAFVIKGLVEANTTAHIKQSNQALNLWKPEFITEAKLPTVGTGTATVYREKTYTAAELPNDSFDMMLWNGAPSKVITFEVTQPKDATTKIIYKIDYSAVTFAD
ncbi:MAG: hypothetical protein LBQ77_01440 [Treponema sp.]|jgi:hypothetical protein|nr:hypothetical protein [Treponema sp.]